MLTWRQGTRILAEVFKKDEVNLADFITMIAKSSITRASGTAVFLTGNQMRRPRLCYTTSNTTRFCTRTTSS
jgi:KUP system potassium uptake protein